MVHLQELYRKINTVNESVCIFYSRHLEVLFTSPQSMNNLRKSEGIFPVITSDITRKILANRAALRGKRGLVRANCPIFLLSYLTSSHIIIRHFILCIELQICLSEF